MAGTVGSAGVVMEAQGNVTLIRVGALPIGEKRSPSVLNTALMDRFDECLSQVERAGAKALVIRSCIAGADVKMLDACTTRAELTAMSVRGQALASRLSRLGMPTVAAIDGFALGGGLELALACTYRVATRTTRVGLPEVKLGLLPGAGGTQRLPPLVGIQEALTLMTTGKTLKAEAALRRGLLDEVVEEGALESTAVRAAQGLAEGTLKPKRRMNARGGWALWALEGNPLGRALLWARAGKAIRAAAGPHYPAPAAILSAVRAGVESGEAAGLAVEAAEFGALGVTPTSTALRGIFFAETATKKNPFGKPPGPHVGVVGVLGAGLMGAGIALVCSDPGGLGVVLKDRDHPSLSRGVAQIEAALTARVKKKQLSRFDADVVSSRVQGVTDGDDEGRAWRRQFGRVDLVIEAVPEDLALKHAVLVEMQGVLPPHAVFASNTSALSIASIAAGGAPALSPQVVGLHFFSPADRMPLCEVIPHEGTSTSTAALAVSTAHALGKTVIVVKDVPGFYVNRCLAPMLAETVALVQAGVPPDVLDAVVRGFGMPVGPCALTDEVGVDVSHHVLVTMSAALGGRMGGPNPDGLREAVRAGFLGRKGGRGFYLYPPPGGGGKEGTTSPLRPVNADMVRLQRGLHSSGRGYDGKTVASLLHDRTQLEDRLVLRFVKECIHSLQDGVIRSPGDGDIGAVFGLGWPPFRGGPFRYVDTRGPRATLEAMARLAETVGPQYEPPQLLRDLVAKGGAFHA